MARLSVIACGMSRQSRLSHLRRELAAVLRHSPLGNSRKAVGGKLSPLASYPRPISTSERMVFPPAPAVPAAAASSSFYAEFDSFADHHANGHAVAFHKRVAASKHRLTSDQKNALGASEPEAGSRIGFKVRIFKSGEVTGGQFLTGSRFKMIPPSRSGSVVTECFTRPAQIKIRRSVECSETLLGKFCTLTFSPALVPVESKNSDGTVCHSYAKKELVRFLNTCTHKQKRLGRELHYLWVAEVQSNGNIHFHILWDQFFDIKWLSKIWGQANNSVDIVRMKNPLHASRYMRKYMTKTVNSAIQGNRYNISAPLRATMIPVEKIIFEMTANDATYAKNSVSRLRSSLHDLASIIEARGGKVMEFGFSIPPGRSPVEYRASNGEMKKTVGVDGTLGKSVVQTFVQMGKRLDLSVVPF